MRFLARAEGASGVSLSAGDRFGGGPAALAGRRPAAVLGASIGLHLVVMVGMVALGHRMTARVESPTMELVFEASAAPAVAPAVAIERAEPVAPEVVPAVTTPEVMREASSPEVVASPTPPAVAEASVAAAVSVPVAERAEIQAADAAAPLTTEARVVPSPRRVPPPPARVAARAAPERHLARASETPASVPAPAAATVGALAQPVALPLPPVRKEPTISARWQGELSGWIRARTRYPVEAKQRGEQGAVVISFTVGRDGQVIEALLRQRSGSETLDQAALAMFRAARVPAFPPEMDVSQVTISVPVRYRIED